MAVNDSTSFADAACSQALKPMAAIAANAFRTAFNEMSECVSRIAPKCGFDEVIGLYLKLMKDEMRRHEGKWDLGPRARGKARRRSAGARARREVRS
jgi:hypothetical protein